MNIEFQLFIEIISILILSSIGYIGIELRILKSDVKKIYEPLIRHDEKIKSLNEKIENLEEKIK